MFGSSRLDHNRYERLLSKRTHTCWPIRPVSTNATNPDRLFRLECDPISAHQANRSWHARCYIAVIPKLWAEKIYLTREHWGCLQAA
jgi:hypothetical protein